MEARKPPRSENWGAVLPEYAARLESGRYKITAMLTDLRRQTSATIRVDVR